MPCARNLKDSLGRGMGAFRRGSTLRRLLGCALAGGMLFAAAPAFAQFGGPCDPAQLKAITGDYLKAQTTGDTSVIPMGLWVDYNQNLEESTMATGVISTPQKIDFTRTIYDNKTCTSYTEVIITDPAHPYVLGAQISERGGQLGGINVMVTDKANGWLFNPANTLKYSKAENWSEIPEAERDSRDTLIAAANAYLDYFDDKKVVVPWGTPCERLEGGLYTSKAAPGQSLPDDSCNVGVPNNIKLVDRQYIVDESLGAVTVLLHFANDQVPDAHTFRVEHGKIRYVHTITACKVANCGLKMPDNVKTALGN
jgi:hypothetical protein